MEVILILVLVFGILGGVILAWVNHFRFGALKKQVTAAERELVILRKRLQEWAEQDSQQDHLKPQEDQGASVSKSEQLEKPAKAEKAAARK